MSDMAGLRKLNVASFMWFVSFAEANDWLPFDGFAEDVESVALSEPDKHTEWAFWYNKWEAEGEPDF